MFASTLFLFLFLVMANGCTTAFHCCAALILSKSIYIHSVWRANHEMLFSEIRTLPVNSFAGSKVRWQLFIHFNAILRCLCTYFGSIPVGLFDHFIRWRRVIASSPQIRCVCSCEEDRLMHWGSIQQSCHIHGAMTMRPDGEMGRGGRVADYVTEWP